MRSSQGFGFDKAASFSPFLFIIVIDFVMRRTMGKPEYGSVWQKQNCLTDLDFADDITILAEEERRMPRDDYQARGTKCTSWTEYKPGENEGHVNHPASIITTNSRCTREHRICRKIHLPGKCNI